MEIGPIHIKSAHISNFLAFLWNLLMKDEEMQNSVSLSVAQSIADIILVVDGSYDSLLVCQNFPLYDMIGFCSSVVLLGILFLHSNLTL